MRRSSLGSMIVALAVVGALASVGCSKKQVRQEAEKPSTTTQVTETKPETSTPRRPVRETPIEPRKPEPPPPRAAAVEPAPEKPSPDRGLSQETTPGLERIHFDFDQSVITPAARDVLARNAEYLLANPGVRVRIEGHCDERGTTEYNLGLGERRAKSAQQYLMDLGVDPNRMSIVSYGEEMPLDPGHNEDAWAKNRRAEFVETRR